MNRGRLRSTRERARRSETRRARGARANARDGGARKRARRYVKQCVIRARRDQSVPRVVFFGVVDASRSRTAGRARRDMPAPARALVSRARRAFARAHRALSTTASPTHETVVGVEIHARLATRSKLFSGAASAYGGDANARVAPFDAALPGTLPVLNAGAVALAIKLGIALEGTVQLKSSFDRKHYYYADLPHGYQITQQREPIVRGGIVRCVGVENAREGDRDGGRTRRGWLTVGIERVQMETDTGKSQTVGAEAEAAQGTLVDLNRAGQALVEIVSEPDMRSGEDAAACVEALQRMLRYLHVSDANMEEGSLRCDVNVSVRTAEERERGVFGERVEIKNLNSLRSIVRAVKYEAKRHVDVLTAGGRIERETRAFDTNTGKTTVLRTKENLLDYRFTPEPDLPPLVLNPADVEAIANRMPELPNAAFERLMESGASESAASTIIAFPSTLKYYDTAVDSCGAAKASDVANFIANEIIGAARKDAGASHKEPLSSLPRAASARRVGELLGKVANGDLSGRMAKQVLEALMNSDERALAEIVEDVCGGGQMSSDDQLQDICRAVVDEMPKEVELFRGGKSKLMGALVGEVMKRTNGRANPKDASKMLADVIASLS